MSNLLFLPAIQLTKLQNSGAEQMPDRYRLCLKTSCVQNLIEVCILSLHFKHMCFLEHEPYLFQCFFACFFFLTIEKSVFSLQHILLTFSALTSFEISYNIKYLASQMHTHIQLYLSCPFMILYQMVWQGLLGNKFQEEVKP